MQPVDPEPLAIRLVAMTLAVLALFTIFPRIDLAVSSIFYTPGAGFLAAEQAWLNGLRRLVWTLSQIMVLVALAGLVTCWRLRCAVLRMTTRDWGFILAIYAIGTMLLVEAMLKRTWGRARPADVTEFGGTRMFTAATDIADQCQRNCSFTSGEMSGAVALAVALALILWRWRDKLSEKAMQVARIILVSQVVLVGVQRIATGRHFLSDVILSALFTLLVAVAIVPLLHPGEDRAGPQ